MTEVTGLRRQLELTGNLILDVKVIPRASKSEIVAFLEDGSLKVKLHAIPERGKANEELQTLLAVALQIPKRNVTILSGESSQHKRVRISAA